MSELTPVPKGMCPAFYQFMGAGSPRSDSGEILMLKDKEAPDPAAELVAKAREAVDDLQGAARFSVAYGFLANAEKFTRTADSLAAALDAYEQGGAK
jgi:hypothetical protein